MNFSVKNCLSIYLFLHLLGNFHIGVKKSAGVIVCFRKKFSNLIKQMKVDYEIMIVFHIDKLLFATDGDIFFIGLYYHRVSPPFMARHKTDMGLNLWSSV